MSNVKPKLENMTNARNEFGLRKILVATDLSPRAEKAVARAMQLAEEHNSALIVVHVLSVAAGDKTRTREMAAKIEEDLRRKVHVRSHRNGRSVKIRVLSGTPFVEIIRRARAEEADLILAGAHGTDFLKDLLVGSTAQKVVRKGDRPVLIVKQAARSLYRRLLVAVDFLGGLPPCTGGGFAARAPRRVLRPARLSRIRRTALESGFHILRG